MGFAEKVRELLKSHRLSQADLAASLGTNQQQVSRWLESNTPPKSTYLLRLARALGVTADYLIDDAQESPAPAEPLVSDDERYVVRTIRALDLTFEEAVRRLALAAGEVSAEPQGRVQPLRQAKVLAVQNHDEQARRERQEAIEKQEASEKHDERRRLGFKLESDCKADRGHHVSPVPPGRY